MFLFYFISPYLLGIYLASNRRAILAFKLATAVSSFQRF